MTVLQAVVLGIVQGLAEFLPISSSGHLKVFQMLFGLEEPNMAFDILLHVATLIPVLIVFREDIISLIKKPFQKLTLLIILGTLPLVFIELFLGDLITPIFETGKYLGVCFIITGILLLASDRMGEGYKKMKNVTSLDAVIIGCVQGIAILPAISRSGSTITGALSRNLSRRTAAKFSFLLSIPAILGAAVLQIKDIFTGEISIAHLTLMPVVFGFLAAMLSGYLAIRFMLDLIRKCKLQYFSYYLFVLGGLIILDQLVTKIYF